MAVVNNDGAFVTADGGAWQRIVGPGDQPRAVSIAGGIGRVGVVNNDGAFVRSGNGPFQMIVGPADQPIDIAAG